MIPPERLSDAAAQRRDSGMASEKWKSENGKIDNCETRENLRLERAVVVCFL
jgi:hypothetical protein